MADELEKWAKHEKRIADMEPIVESLQWHHRNDRVLERLNEISERSRQALATAERAEGRIEKIVIPPVAIAAKKDAENGNGNLHARMRWVERILWGAIGAVAMFELMARIWKPGG